MRAIWTIFRKELKTFLSTPSFWFVAALASIYMGISYFDSIYNFTRMSTFSMQMQGQDGGVNFHERVILSHISGLNLVLFFVTPFLTMRLFSEEKKLRTFDLLLTSPITSAQIVIGKYFAGVAAIGSLILLSMVYPLLTRLYISIEWGTFIAAYAGLFFISSIYVAVALFCSSITESLFLGGIMSMIFNLMLWIMQAAKGMSDEPTLTKMFEHIWIGTHFISLAQGSLQSASIVFLVSVIFFFTFLTERIVESARWR